jgi:hypothetical protein
MTTINARRRGFSRREIVKTAATVGLMAGISPIIQTRPAHAAKKTLKILQWSHFVPADDKWFNNEYVKEWGDKNNTEVTVDNINLGLIPSRAAAEVSAQKGHDLILFLSPPSVYESQVADLSDVYAECEKKHGKPIDLAVKSTYNPKTKKYFAFPVPATSSLTARWSPGFRPVCATSRWYSRAMRSTRISRSPGTSHFHCAPSGRQRQKSAKKSNGRLPCLESTTFLSVSRDSYRAVSVSGLP